MTQRCSVATASNSTAPLHFSINVTVPFACHVAPHESEAALLLTPGGFQIYSRAHEAPGHAASTMWASSRSSGPPAAKQNCTGRTTPAHALSQYLHQHPERD